MPIFNKGEKNILFIHIPKCGGSSICDSFKNLGYNVILEMKGLPIQSSLISSPQHLTSRQLLSIIDFNNIDEIFTIVRNPFERIKSEYKWAHRTCKNIEDFEDYEKWVFNSLDSAEKNKSFNDNHFLPMHEFISELNVCKIFKFEAGINHVLEFYEDLSSFKEFEVSKKNRSEDYLIDSIIPCDKKISNDLKERIIEFYNLDFEFFAYSKDVKDNKKINNQLNKLDNKIAILNAISKTNTELVYLFSKRIDYLKKDLEKDINYKKDITNLLRKLLREFNLEDNFQDYQKDLLFSDKNLSIKLKILLDDIQESLKMIKKNLE